MKKFIFSGVLILLLGKVYSQAVITLPTTSSSLKTIQDFGAIANDGIDDSWAFIKAGKYFSNVWDINGVPLTGANINFDKTQYSGRLEIPAGTYNVGIQINGPCNLTNITWHDLFPFQNYNNDVIPISNLSQRYKIGFGGILLESVDQIEIIGTGGTPSIEAPDVKTIGLFECGGNALFFNTSGQLITATGGLPAGAPFSWGYSCSLPAMINMIYSTNVFVHNINFEGKNNSPNTLYNGGYGIDKLQMGQEGIHCSSSQNISITDMLINNMSFDGIDFVDPILNPISATPSNLYINHTIVENSRRNGLSITGCKHYTIENSQFNNTGQNVYNYMNPAGQYVARANPGAGIDLEPEGSGLLAQYVTDGTMTHVACQNNAGVGLVNDSGSDRLIGLEVDNCTFWSVTNYSVWAKGKNIHFKNGTNFHGPFVHGNNGLIVGEETTFTDCNFENKSYMGQPLLREYLLESAGFTRGMKFTNCHFKVNYGKRMMWMETAASVPESRNTKFINCDFSTDATTYSGAGYSYLEGVSFIGNNSVTNNSTNLAIKLFWAPNNIIFEGSPSACDPYRFSLNGAVLWTQESFNGNNFVLGRDYDLSGNPTTNGFFNFDINMDAMLYHYWSTNLTSGKHSTLSVSKGGSFRKLGGNIYLDGKISCHEASFFGFGGTATNWIAPYNNIGELYIHKNGTFGIGPTWSYLGSAVNGLGSFNTNICFDGGHAALSASNFQCSVTEALNFDGNDVVTVTNTNKLSCIASQITKEFTIEIAFRINNNSDNVLISKGKTSAIDYEVGIAKNPMNIRNPYLNIAGNIYWFNIDYGASNYAGGCNTITIRRNSSGTLICNINKDLISNTNTSLVTMPTTTYDLLFGKSCLTTNPVAPLNGYIGEVRLWRRCLSDQEICYNYSRKEPYDNTDLIADWDMTDGINSLTVMDLIPNNQANGLLGVCNANPPLSYCPKWLTQNEVGVCNNSYNNFRVEQESGNIQEDFVNIFPNPNNGTFKLNVPLIEATFMNVNVFDIYGKTVYHEQISCENHAIFEKEINLHSSSPGIYLLVIEDGTNKHTKKIVVE